MVLRVTGFLKFAKVPNFDYGVVKIPGKATVISRQGKEQVVINDERGPGKKWRLTAMLTKEASGLAQKSGQLLYVHDNGQKEIMEPDKLILVKEEETQKQALQPLDWQEKGGLLFNVLPNSYSGVINWMLEDVPTS